jgi:hypothetical protein
MPREPWFQISSPKLIKSLKTHNLNTSDIDFYFFFLLIFSSLFFFSTILLRPVLAHRKRNRFTDRFAFLSWNIHILKHSKDDLVLSKRVSSAFNKVQRSCRFFEPILPYMRKVGDLEQFYCWAWAQLINSIRFQSSCTYKVFHKLLPESHMFIGPVFESDHQTPSVDKKMRGRNHPTAVYRWKESEYFLEWQFLLMVTIMFKVIFRIEWTKGFAVDWNREWHSANKNHPTLLVDEGWVFWTYSTVTNWINGINRDENIFFHISANRNLPGAAINHLIVIAFGVFFHSAR